MKTKQLNALRAFTLVEIMIVVAIIAVLAAIVIPNFLQAGARSKANACINNLRQIDTAVQEFAIEAKKHVGDPVVYPTDLTAYIHLDAQGLIPTCPSGGAYSLAVVGSYPSAFCSLGTTVQPAHVQP